ncbi:Vacuolar protein sorting-associated protein 26B-B, partial [Geodia barretti]
RSSLFLRATCCAALSTDGSSFSIHCWSQNGTPDVTSRSIISAHSPNIYTENEQVAKYEIMDGAPVRGESIPIRLFLSGYDLTPTMRDVNKKLSVRYYVNLVLVDEEERRYFKQQEIVLWRKADPKAARKSVKK